ncbi:hypothetical protein PAXINDRAFT_95763 [Paxillus involutus ATCC 200175]|nr:hypothetical protein PAXINDRAFT_95763 [Paxillus involutus ATCC 200175]
MPLIRMRFNGITRGTSAFHHDQWLPRSVPATASSLPLQLRSLLLGPQYPSQKSYKQDAWALSSTTSSGSSALSPLRNPSSVVVNVIAALRY